MVKLAVEPWNGEQEALLLMDRQKKGDVPPYPYCPLGGDVRANEWSEIDE